MWLRSLPSRERGLKYKTYIASLALNAVAPLAGAWIEISLFTRDKTGVGVAPLAGAWIEML